MCFEKLEDKAISLEQLLSSWIALKYHPEMKTVIGILKYIKNADVRSFIIMISTCYNNIQN